MGPQNTVARRGRRAWLGEKIKLMSSFKSLYKGSTIEIAPHEHVPDHWMVAFDIRAKTLPAGDVAVGWMMRSGFKTREDALDWARKEIDGLG